MKEKTYMCDIVIANTLFYGGDVSVECSDHKQICPCQSRSGVALL
jgi:hypothetical protein